MKSIYLFIVLIVCLSSCGRDIDGISPEEYIEQKGLSAESLGDGGYIIINDRGTEPKANVNDAVLLDVVNIAAETDEVFEELEDARVRVGSVIEGLRLGLQEIGAGGSCRLILPPTLAFGDSEFSNLPPKSTVVVDVNLKEITSLTDVQGYVDRYDLQTNTLDQGVQIHIIETGSEMMPTASSDVTVNYVGKFTDEIIFDQGQDVSFNLNGLIDGWKIGLPQIGVGGKCILVIPPDAAYGAQGSRSIPPNTPIVFEIDLLAVGS